MIIVDGRTDREKLAELLRAPEQTHLEFKKELDLNDNESQLNFVKDAVSMANRPPGGYILIGVSDDGVLALPAGSIADRARFDGARIGDLIRKYTDGEVHAISQIHELDGHEVVLIHIPANRDGLPIPMSKMGQFQGTNGKQRVIFREGDVPIREGAKNTPLRHAHWNDLLALRDQRIRQEARSDVDSLLKDLASALRPGGASLVPLAMESDNATFSESVVSHLETNSEIRLSQFIRQAGSLIPSEQHQAALDKITIVAAQSMFFERDIPVQRAIDTLYDAYSKLDRVNINQRLEIITRVYMLGSLAVRLRQWHHVQNLVLQNYEVTSSYTYASWIRHGQVEASRAGLFPAGNDGLMISAARELFKHLPPARPDIPDLPGSDSGNLLQDDLLFNSLCQFDVLYCLIVTAESSEEAAGYPAASAMDQRRSNPAFDLVAVDDAARKTLFPTANDVAIAEAMNEVFSLAKRESFKAAGGWWSQLPNAARSFVDANLPSRT
ncbi:AlbA family DNA-binding domain-containing protein [Arthrobacter koreensis]|uniref:AlbA family DNA-binding domain-containing protein n=1 Tax=Arthrobacter koreensis TaxID=199136 RepID=UPI003D91B30A